MSNKDANFTFKSGKTMKNDGTIVNIADLIESLNTNLEKIDNLDNNLDDLNTRTDTLITAIAALNTLLTTIDNNIDSTLGRNGGQYIADTNAHTPGGSNKFVAIQVVSECVATIVGNITGITGVTLPANTIIYGEYTSITLASGSVMAYIGV